MASSVWRNILAAGQAGKMAGDALGGIGRGIYAGFNEGLTPEQQIQRDYQEKLYQQKLADDVAQLQLKDPNLMEGSQAIQPGMTVDGQRSVKPLEMTPGQQEAMLVGQPIPEVNTVSLGGRAFDPAAIKSATIEDELRQADAKRRLYETMAGQRGTGNQFITDPITGAVYLGNKATGVVAPTTQAGNEQFKVGTRLTQKEIVDPNTGIKKLVNVDASGNVVGEIGTSDMPKGTVVQDPVTGAVSVVNNMLPQGTGPGQASPVNQPTGQATNQKPFSVGVKPTPMTEGQAKDVGFASSMLKANQSLEALEKANYDPTKLNAENVIPSYFPKIMRSDDRKAFDLAKEGFTQAVLRKETGAAIQKQEQEWVNARFMPEANDPPSIVQDKKVNRILAAEIMARTATGAKLTREEIDQYISQAKAAGQNGGKTTSFSSVEEAEAAGLPPGTEITVGGKRAITE
jgi:hypothetical protein